MRHRRLRRAPAGAGDPARRACAKLEYRGYDSAGISVIADGEIESVRAVGNLDDLREARRRAAAERAAAARRGRHARRRRPASATRAGRRTGASTRPTPTRTSTRPTASTSSSTASSRTTSRSSSACSTWARSSPPRPTPRSSPTWSPTTWLSAASTEAVRAAYAELEGHFAFVAMTLDEPDVLVGARKRVPAGRRPRRGRDASSPPRSPRSSPTRASVQSSRTARSS